MIQHFIMYGSPHISSSFVSITGSETLGSYPASGLPSKDQGRTLTGLGNDQIDTFTTSNMNQVPYQNEVTGSSHNYSLLQDTPAPSLESPLAMLCFNDIPGSGLGDQTEPASYPSSLVSSPAQVQTENYGSVSPVKHAFRLPNMSELPHHDSHGSVTDTLSSTRFTNSQKRLNWAEMICYTIFESPDEKLVVQELFERMCHKYPEVAQWATGLKWEARVKNRIKSTLSIKGNLFIKLPKPDRPSGKGSWWALSPEAKIAIREGRITDAIKGIGISPIREKSEIVESTTKEPFTPIQAKSVHHAGMSKRMRYSFPTGCLSTVAQEQNSVKSMSNVFTNHSTSPELRGGAYDDLMLADRRFGAKMLPEISNLNPNGTMLDGVAVGKADLGTTGIINSTTPLSMFTQFPSSSTTSQANITSILPDVTPTLSTPMPLMPSGLQTSNSEKYGHDLNEPYLCKNPMLESTSLHSSLMSANNAGNNFANMSHCLPDNSSLLSTNSVLTGTDMRYGMQNDSNNKMMLGSAANNCENIEMNSVKNAAYDSPDNMSPDFQILCSPLQASSKNSMISPIQNNFIHSPSVLTNNFAFTMNNEPRGLEPRTQGESSSNMYDILMSNLLGASTLTP